MALFIFCSDLQVHDGDDTGITSDTLTGDVRGYGCWQVTTKVFVYLKNISMEVAYRQSSARKWLVMTMTEGSSTISWCYYPGGGSCMHQSLLVTTLPLTGRWGYLHVLLKLFSVPHVCWANLNFYTRVSVKQHRLTIYLLREQQSEREKKEQRVTDTSQLQLPSKDLSKIRGHLLRKEKTEESRSTEELWVTFTSEHPPSFLFFPMSVTEELMRDFTSFTNSKC